MLKLVKCSRKGVHTANIKIVGERFGERLTDIKIVIIPKMKFIRKSIVRYQSDNSSIAY